jgi:Holliday junction DNA helicase RuvA
MISHIIGIVVLANSSDGTISVMTQGGVGYCVFVGVKTSISTTIGQNVSLFVESIVKEDSFNLYGFQTYEQQVVFNSLLKVSGVGAKVAISVLDHFSTQDIVQAIIAENAGMFQQIGGLGEKVSSRIVAELKKEPAKIAKILALTKLGNTHGILNCMANSIKFENKSQVNEGENANENVTESLKVSVQDVTSALVNLGFDYNRSFACASQVVKKANTIEDAIVEALRGINQ